MKRLRVSLLAGLVASAGVGTPCLSADLLSEDFEGLALGPFVSPTESGGDGTDWTDQLPTGWTMTFSGPLGNPIEFQGWHVLDVDSWIATENHQGRSSWSRGGVGAHGSALVADPDAYADGTGISTGLFNTFIETPAIDLSRLTPNSVMISFDSSFRNDPPQTATLDVTFDGGTYFRLLTYDPANLGGDQLIDERPELAVSNPPSGSSGSVSNRPTTTGGGPSTTCW